MQNAGQHGDGERSPLRRWGRARRVAQFLDVHVSTVWRLTADGKLPQPTKFGSLTLWDLDQVAAAVERASEHQPPP